MKLTSARLNQQQGIGLLELMLALAIIAVLLIMATRYYSTAHQNQQMSSAVDMYTAVAGATKNYFNDKQAYPTTINQLTTGGYLPSSYANGTSVNPWNGDITISTSAGVVTVTMTNIPTGVCTPLSERLKLITYGATPPACSGSSLPATFAI